MRVAIRTLAPIIAMATTKRNAAAMSMSASDFINDVNTKYEALHRSFEEQFSTLNRHFEHADVKTKSLMLTAYAKLANLYPALRPHVTREMKKLQRHAELELQQRACEYLSLGEQADDFVEDVLREMPAYAADRESALEKFRAAFVPGGDAAASSSSPLPLFLEGWAYGGTGYFLSAALLRDIGRAACAR